MIVDPDFLDHWRTQMLIDTLDDPCAPQYVIRLWGHCQNRRAWVFDDMPVQAAKAICRYRGDAQEFEKAMIHCGFIARKERQITVVGWDEHNASLIANWVNGSRGGRPKGSGKESRGKPMGKPKENPSDNPSGTDKIGCDVIGDDKAHVPSGDGTFEYTADFEQAWKDKPAREGGNSKKAAFKAWKASIRRGAKIDQLTNGMSRYKAYCQEKGIIGTDKVKMMSTFWGPDEHYLEDYVAQKELEHQPAALPMHRQEMPKPDRPARRN